MEVARKKKRKKKKIIKKWKAKAIAAKYQKDRGRINLSGEDKKNYDSDTADGNTNLDQANNKNPLPSCNNY